MKRLLDFTASFIGLVILSPVLIIVAILVATKLGTPVFFTQERPGKNGRIFKMIKFRSMTNEKDENGNLLPNDKRLTSFGRWLRSTSLDEIPGLFNVLKGDMSLVGPRPLRVHYLPLYNEFENRRHEVKPGITGWAQVNGRNAISWEEKFKYDVWYVDNRNLLLDIKILFLTVLKVVKRDGITHQNDAAMPEFKGHNQ
jgi:sugar transferase EpsL